jgi:NADPH2 dehydrogenase
VPGTLIITEKTVGSASPDSFNAPGILQEDQVAAWRAITDEVHSKGCFIFCQLFAMGRTADIDIVGPSAIPIEEGGAMPRAMTIEEIKEWVLDFVHASRNAIRAGFDGVEIRTCLGRNPFRSRLPYDFL